MTTEKRKSSATQPLTAHKRKKRSAALDAPKAAPGAWALRDAKAKLSEVINRVHSNGPQRLTVRGKREVVIITAEEFRRLKGEATGQQLIDALLNSPLRDIQIERLSVKAPVRDVEL